MHRPSIPTRGIFLAAATLLAALAGSHHVPERSKALAGMVPEESVSKLDGSVLDLPSSPMQSGLVLRNPNRPNPLAGKQLDLSGELPERVQQLLDQSVNPSLASHGGFVELAGVEDTVVYLSMGGGCQGCGAADVTLKQGIERLIKEEIPEVEEVLDTTDHASGENPYYQPTK